MQLNHSADLAAQNEQLKTKLAQMDNKIAQFDEKEQGYSHQAVLPATGPQYAQPVMMEATVLPPQPEHPINITNVNDVSYEYDYKERFSGEI